MTVVDAAAGEVADYAHGRVPRAVRERQVLAAAEELFAEQGYARASMDELARRVGVSKPVIYDLVGSKEQLYRRCVERLSEQLAARLAAAVGAEADAGPLAQFRTGVRAFFSFVSEHRQEWEALAWDASPFAAEAAAMRRKQTELVVRLLTGATARVGIVVDQHETDAVAHALNGAMEALARWWHDHDGVDAEQLTGWAVDLLLPGLERIGGLRDMNEAQG